MEEKTYSGDFGGLVAVRTQWWATNNEHLSAALGRSQVTTENHLVLLIEPTGRALLHSDWTH